MTKPVSLLGGVNLIDNHVVYLLARRLWELPTVLLVSPPLASVTILESVVPLLPCGGHEDAMLRSHFRKDLLHREAPSGFLASLGQGLTLLGWPPASD